MVVCACRSSTVRSTVTVFQTDRSRSTVDQLDPSPVVRVQVRTPCSQYHTNHTAVLRSGNGQGAEMDRNLLRGKISGQPKSVGDVLKKSGSLRLPEHTSVPRNISFECSAVRVYEVRKSSSVSRLHVSLCSSRVAYTSGRKSKDRSVFLFMFERSLNFCPRRCIHGTRGVLVRDYQQAPTSRVYDTWFKPCAYSKNRCRC